MTPSSNDWCWPSPAAREREVKAQKHRPDARRSPRQLRFSGVVVRRGGCDLFDGDFEGRAQASGSTPWNVAISSDRRKLLEGAPGSNARRAASRWP
jgi:hypothetical protein